jgi:hypothetical protein
MKTLLGLFEEYQFCYERFKELSSYDNRFKHNLEYAKRDMIKAEQELFDYTVKRLIESSERNSV